MYIVWIGLTVILIVGAGILGWFLRNKVLHRQIQHSRIKLNEMESMHVNLQNEISLLRQKGREYDGVKRSLDDALINLKKQQDETRNIREEFQALKSGSAGVSGEKELLLKQLSTLESEKAKLTQNLKLLQKENESLRENISGLNDRIEVFEKRAVRVEQDSMRAIPKGSSTRASQSTEKFGKKERARKETSSTGIRMLEKIAEELRDPKPPKS